MGLLHFSLIRVEKHGTKGNEEEIQGQIGIIGFCAMISRAEW